MSCWTREATNAASGFFWFHLVPIIVVADRRIWGLLLKRPRERHRRGSMKMSKRWWCQSAPRRHFYLRWPPPLASNDSFKRLCAPLGSDGSCRSTAEPQQPPCSAPFSVIMFPGHFDPDHVWHKRRKCPKWRQCYLELILPLPLVLFREQQQ